ncbi:MAG: methyltransferase domain-containing protein [Proteobacteria bacterium]|nr:methyltransferase domain-containing protein [Pseudomonadota bacterium]
MSEILFDLDLLRQNRARAFKNFAQHNFLYHEVANRIAENLELLNRKFERILELDAMDDYLQKLVTMSLSKGDEIIFDMLSETPSEGSYDLIISNLNFHYINEIPQYLLQIKNLLTPDGIFIASFFGEENLSQLAHVLHKTENEIYDGISPRMPPTIDVKTAAALLHKAGFQNPISVFDRIEVDYSSPLDLLKDLKMMGQGNILTQRSRRFFTKNFLNKISENYREMYGIFESKVLATFEIVTIMGAK